jgi:uncharacterized protein YjaZ
VAECDQRLDLLRQSMLQHLEQSDPALQSLYFHMHDQPQHPIPARAGYVVGYRVLQRLAQTNTVEEMARWPLDRVCLELRTVLALQPFA